MPRPKRSAAKKNESKAKAGGGGSTIDKTAATAATETPTVTLDPRFLAGRKLVQSGKAENGIEMFAVLVEEARQRFGDAGSIEVAPAYYEYGNALLRAALRGSSEPEEADVGPNNNKDARNAAAEAAEKRMKVKDTAENDLTSEDSKPVAKSKVETHETTIDSETGTETVKADSEPKALGDIIKSEDPDEKKPHALEVISSGVTDSAKNDEGSDLDLDLALALEMMENAYSILDEYHDDQSNVQYRTWTNQQLPRVLLGLGDCLSAMARHADSADAYSRALELRQAELAKFDKTDLTIQHLQAHRRVCEATVLIAEELLACPPDCDVVTTETKSLIVTRDERIEYARGYYDKARDALQEAVFHMGSIAAKSVDVSSEKEDTCFVATMVMGVGTSLQEIDDAATAPSDVRAKEPPTKKQKK